MENMLEVPGSNLVPVLMTSELDSDSDQMPPPKNSVCITVRERESDAWD